MNEFFNPERIFHIRVRLLIVIIGLFIFNLVNCVTVGKNSNSPLMYNYNKKKVGLNDSVKDTAIIDSVENSEVSK